MLVSLDKNIRYNILNKKQKNLKQFIKKVEDEKYPVKVIIAKWRGGFLDFLICFDFNFRIFFLLYPKVV